MLGEYRRCVAELVEVTDPWNQLFVAAVLGREGVLTIVDVVSGDAVACRPLPDSSATVALLSARIAYRNRGVAPIGNKLFIVDENAATDPKEFMLYKVVIFFPFTLKRRSSGDQYQKNNNKAYENAVDCLILL